jgi:uncharacterized membrane protein (UPF0127 family)
VDVVVMTAPDGRPVRVAVAVSRRERMRGLREGLPVGCDGMLFPRTRSVHTFGMRVPLRVVLLDREGAVVRDRVVPPGRVVLPRLRVRAVLELAYRPS